MYQGISSAGWGPFQKTSTGYQKAKDASQKQGTRSTPISTQTPNMRASDHANGNQFFSSQDKEEPGIVGQSGVKYNFEQSVDFMRDHMIDKSMHQQITVRNGVNYPVSISLSNCTPKYKELMAILGDNESVEELIKRAQTSQWHFTISGMHFLERAVDKELDALSDSLCTPTAAEFKKSEKHKKRKKLVESAKKPRPKTKLCFERYKATQIKGTDLLKLYFFSKIAENAKSLLAGENIWLDKGGHRIWPVTENVRANKWWKSPPDLVAERFHRSELEALLTGTYKHLPCGQRWLTSKFLSPPAGFSGTDPEETSPKEGLDGHHTPPSHNPIPDDKQHDDAGDPSCSPGLSLKYSSEEGTEAESDDGHGEGGFKKIGQPIFTGNLKDDCKVFFNADHGKHIKIGPVKILSGGYCGEKIAEEIKNPLIDIVTNNNMTYVVH